MFMSPSLIIIISRLHNKLKIKYWLNNHNKQSLSIVVCVHIDLYIEAYLLFLHRWENRKQSFHHSKHNVGKIHIFPRKQGSWIGYDQMWWTIQRKSDDQFVCYQNQGYEDESHANPFRRRPMTRPGQKTLLTQMWANTTKSLRRKSLEMISSPVTRMKGTENPNQTGPKTAIDLRRRSQMISQRALMFCCEKRWVKLTLDYQHNTVQFNIINSQDVSWYDIFINKHPCVSILTGVCVYQDLNVDYLHKIILLV